MTRAAAVVDALRRVAGVALVLLLPVLALQAFLFAYGDPALFAATAGWWGTGTGRVVLFAAAVLAVFHGTDHVRQVAVERDEPSRGFLVVEVLLVLTTAAYGAWALFARGVGA